MKRNDTQLMSEIFKRCLGEGLSKDVCNLFCSGNVMGLNNLIGDLLSQKMIFYGNMFCLGVEDRIFRHTNGTCVITMNWDRCNIFYL
jgi:hypothetical protein